MFAWTVLFGLLTFQHLCCLCMHLFTLLFICWLCGWFSLCCYLLLNCVCCLLLVCICLCLCIVWLWWGFRFSFHVTCDGFACVGCLLFDLPTCCFWFAWLWLWVLFWELLWVLLVWWVCLVMLDCGIAGNVYGLSGFGHCAACIILCVLLNWLIDLLECILLFSA